MADAATLQVSRAVPDVAAVRPRGFRTRPCGAAPIADPVPRPWAPAVHPRRLPPVLILQRRRPKPSKRQTIWQELVERTGSVPPPRRRPRGPARPAATRLRGPSGAGQLSRAARPPGRPAPATASTSSSPGGTGRRTPGHRPPPRGTSWPTAATDDASPHGGRRRS